MAEGRRNEGSGSIRVVDGEVQRRCTWAPGDSLWRGFEPPEDGNQWVKVYTEQEYRNLHPSSREIRERQRLFSGLEGEEERAVAFRRWQEKHGIEPG